MTTTWTGRGLGVAAGRIGRIGAERSAVRPSNRPPGRRDTPWRRRQREDTHIMPVESSTASPAERQTFRTDDADRAGAAPPEPQKLERGSKGDDVAKMQQNL